MPRIGTTICTDRDDYRSSYRGSNVELVLTGRADFRARLTWVDLPNLHLLRSQENTPRIAYVTLAPKRVFISFAIHFDPPVTCDGMELKPGEVVLHSIGESPHQRTNGTSDWAFISVAPEYLAKFGKALTGINLVPPSTGLVLRPSAVAATHLRRLLVKACRVAETKPEIIAHKETERGLEQELFHALVRCLTASEVRAGAPSKQDHARIMIRFENVLATVSDRQLQMTELCKAVDVPERTLRICCSEILGMSPGQYMRLRRLNRARSALLRTDAAGMGIAEIAAQNGFSEPGRFAVFYRSVFGETPSNARRAGTRV